MPELTKELGPAALDAPVSPTRGWTVASWLVAHARAVPHLERPLRGRANGRRRARGRASGAGRAGGRNNPDPAVGRRRNAVQSLSGFEFRLRRIGDPGPRRPSPAPAALSAEGARPVGNARDSVHGPSFGLQPWMLEAELPRRERPAVLSLRRDRRGSRPAGLRRMPGSGRLPRVRTDQPARSRRMGRYLRARTPTHPPGTPRPPAGVAELNRSEICSERAGLATAFPANLPTGIGCTFAAAS